MSVVMQHTSSWQCFHISSLLLPLLPTNTYQNNKHQAHAAFPHSIVAKTTNNQFYHFVGSYLAQLFPSLARSFLAYTVMSSFCCNSNNYQV
jgi:hypothetical protein